MWHQIEQYVYGMRAMLILAGVRKRSINVVIRETTKEELTEALTWLHATLLPAVVRLEKTYNLLPPKTWKNYELYEITDTQEQIFLDRYCDNVYSIWQKRPKLLKERHVTAQTA